MNKRAVLLTVLFAVLTWGGAAGIAVGVAQTMDGPRGEQGPTGPRGETGPTGPTGARGPAGQSAIQPLFDLDDVERRVTNAEFRLADIEFCIQHLADFARDVNFYWTMESGGPIFFASRCP